MATVFVTLGLSVPASIGAGVGLADADPLSEDERTPYIVGFHELPDKRQQYQGEPVTMVDERINFFVVETDNPTTFEARTKTDQRVKYLEEDHNDYHLNYVPNDARYSDMYGPQITNTESAWDVTLGSTSVKLGLLDSGITTGHEDFVDSRVSGYDYINGDSTPEDHSGCSYHGSHTAGTAAATTDNGVGVAGMSQSSIIMHKIFDSGFFGCGGASTSEIANALMDLGDKGAHISSNSWGGGGSTTLNDAIQYAHSKGTIHVAAAGNDGSCTDCVGEPWASNPNEVVIVSCSTSSDTFCSFSSQGPEVDIIAPGNNILSVDGGTTSGYQSMSGTSMSTPHVSGAIGLYIAANGDASFSTIEGALGSSADDLGLSAERQGDGRLNTGAFVGGSGGGSNSAPTASFTYSCTDLTCDFDGTGSSDSDGSITSYEWDFGDGNTATGSTVTHTYASGGDYTVTLTVTDDAGATDTDTQTVSVSDGSSGGGDTMHVHDIDHYTKGPHLYIDVWVYDSSENPVSGASVSLEVCDSSNTCATGSGTTDSSGFVDFRWRQAGSGTYTSCVTDLTHDTLTWDSAADHAGSGSCETETV